MAQFDLNKYDTVESRIEKFWTQHENGRILTRLLSDPNQLDEVVVQAEVYADRDDTRPVATGIAFEKRGQSFKDGANVTSHLENCETSAIGRAFANWIFKAKKDSPRPSREEMSKVERSERQPQSQDDRQPRFTGNRTQAPHTPQQAAVDMGRPVNQPANESGPKLCPGCHAPEGRPHARNCKAVAVPA